MKYQVGIVSDTGHQRARNEDAYALPDWVRCSKKHQHERGYVYPKPSQVKTNDLLFLVADGVGGSERGQTASTLATQTAMETYYTAAEPARPDLRLECAVTHTNRVVHAFAKATRQKASTTLVALLCLDKQGFVANVGDSRAYRIRKDTLTLLTQDHSTREEMIRSGQLRAEEGVSVPASRISRSIGRDPDVSPDIFKVEVAPRDRFILCTDGLTRHVNDEELLRYVRESRSPQRAAHALAELAIQRGGKDNITVMVIQRATMVSRRLIYTLLRVLALLILLLGLVWAGWLAYQQAPSAEVQPFASQFSAQFDPRIA
jgi:protein phosphatase